MKLAQLRISQACWLTQQELSLLNAQIMPKSINPAREWQKEALVVDLMITN